MKSLWGTLFLCISFSINLNASNQKSFYEHKKNMEDKVNKIATAYKAAYARRCHPDVLDCTIKSYNLCEGSSKKKCLHLFPLHTNCIGHGAKLANHSGYRFPNSVKTISNENKEFICTTALLEQEFIESAADRNRQFTFAFIGSPQGAIRTYPSTIQAASYGCKDFDSRLRPWYAAATTNGKNIVILVERSKYMRDGKLEAAIIAGKAMINTLSHNDYFSVVLFDSTANIVGKNHHLQKASQLNRETIRYNLDYALPTKNGVNYENAFRVALSILNQKYYGSHCQEVRTIIFVIASGAINSAARDTLITSIEQKNTNLNVNIFFYVLNNLQPDNLISAIACNFNGIVFKSQSLVLMESDFLEIIKEYFEYLVMELHNQEPIWSEVYVDMLGYGSTVTVSKAVFYQQGGTRKFIGVVGYDLQVSTILKKGYKKYEINRLLARKRYCAQGEVNECYIEYLRPTKCLISCTDPLAISQCTTNYSNQFMLEPLSRDPDVCCFLSISQLVAILSGFFVIVFVIFLMIWIRRKKKLKREKKQKKKRQKIQRLRNKRIAQQNSEEVSVVNIFDTKIVSPGEDKQI